MVLPRSRVRKDTKLIADTTSSLFAVAQGGEIKVSCISDGGKLCSYQLGPATIRTAEKAPQSYRFYLYPVQVY